MAYMGICPLGLVAGAYIATGARLAIGGAMGRGAGAGAIRNTPVNRCALSALKEGEAWLTSGTNFELIKIYPWISRRDWRMRIEDGGDSGSAVKDLLRGPT